MRLALLILAILLAAGSASAEPPVSTLGPEGRAFLRLATEDSPAVQCNRCFDRCDRSYGTACRARCHRAMCWDLCGRKRRSCQSDCFELVACRTRRRSCEARPTPESESAAAVLSGLRS